MKLADIINATYELEGLLQLCSQRQVVPENLLQLVEMKAETIHRLAKEWHADSAASSGKEEAHPAETPLYSQPAEAEETPTPATEIEEIAEVPEAPEVPVMPETPMPAPETEFDEEAEVPEAPEVPVMPVMPETPAPAPETEFDEEAEVPEATEVPVMPETPAPAPETEFDEEAEVPEAPEVRPEPAAPAVEFIDDEEEEEAASAPSPKSENYVRLRKLLSVNDRFRFRREIFGNSDTELTNALQFISSLDSIEEAEDYIYHDLGLDPENPETAAFLNFVERFYA